LGEGEEKKSEGGGEVPTADRIQTPRQRESISAGAANMQGGLAAGSSPDTAGNLRKKGRRGKRIIERALTKKKRIYSKLYEISMIRAKISLTVEGSKGMPVYE